MAAEAYDFIEGLESDSEAAEAARAPKRPSSAPSFRPRPAPNAPQYVTQTQLEASLARVDGKVKTVADGVSTINSKIATLTTALKKEASERKNNTEGQNKDLNQKLQMLALLPMLIQTPTATLAAPLALAGGGTLSTVTTPDPNSTLDSLLPLLLISGMGGSGGLGFGGDGSSGSDGGLMMLALVLALSNKS